MLADAALLEAVSHAFWRSVLGNLSPVSLLEGGVPGILALTRASNHQPARALAAAGAS